MSNIEPETEVWKTIPIQPWDELYEVSNLGNVRHKARPVPSRLVVGYPSVTLTKQGYKYTVGVHRLVAAAFIRPPKAAEVVNHINADPTDNSIDNLEWVTQGDNVRHASRIGRMHTWNTMAHAKINPPKAIEMRKSGASLRAIAAHFDCSVTAVCQLLKKAQKDGRLSDPRE